MPFAFSNTPQHGTATVTTPGTPVPISATTLKVTSVSIVPLRTNTGSIWAGTNATTLTQHNLVPWSLQAKDTECLDLSQIYIDAQIAGNGVAWEADSVTHVSAAPIVVSVSGAENVVSTTNDFTASGSITTQNLNPATGIATAGSFVAVTGLNSAGDASIQVTGTYTGALSVQVSVDNVNWITAGGGILNYNTSAQTATIASAAVGIFQVGVEGVQAMRVSALAAVTGTAVVTIRVAATDSTLAIDAPLPTGANVIGALTANQSVNVAQLSGTTPVTAGVAGTLAVGGNIAVGVAPTANPVLAAGITLSTVPAAAIGNGLTQRFSFTGDQQLIIHEDGDPSNEWTATTGVTALATNTSTLATAAGGSGIRNYVKSIQVCNTSATVSTLFSILDGASVIWTMSLPATTAALPQNNVIVNFLPPLKGTAATALNVQCATALAAVYYNLQGYKNN